MSQEPETQIATLGPDSPNQSNRPSLIPNSSNIPRLSIMAPISQQNPNDACLQSSFISEEALKILRRGLNIDRVESAFELYVSLVFSLLQ